MGRGAHGQDHSTAVKRIRINAGSAATASGAEQVRVIAVALDSQDARHSAEMTAVRAEGTRLRLRVIGTAQRGKQRRTASQRRGAKTCGCVD